MAESRYKGLPTNEEILEKRRALFEEVQGPRVGDYVDFGRTDGSLSRISHDWGDKVQTSRGGSWYLAEGHASFSGALDDAIPKEHLHDTGFPKPGRFWFFNQDQPRAHNGVDVEIECRVYSYSDPMYDWNWVGSK